MSHVPARRLPPVSEISTREGRTLRLSEAGDPAGFPVVVQHGTPSSRLLWSEHDDLAREQRLRLIGYDRPGYGGSTRAAGRNVADCAADVTAIADVLSFERYATWGISGGGPHALACAALGDERLVAVASLAAVAPYEAEGLDWLEGMGEENHEEFGKTVEGEPSLRPYLEGQGASELDAEGLISMLRTLLGPEDLAVLTGAFAEYMLEWQRVGLEPGVDGWVDDDLAFAKPWGFEVSAINRPVLLLHGADDRFVPVSHGRWLAARIPGVEARINETDGHLTLLTRRMREVNEWLLSHR
jgi:pimeloyl-ACP methyl ester carboxylesterase